MCPAGPVEQRSHGLLGESLSTKLWTNRVADLDHAATVRLAVEPKVAHHGAAVFAQDQGSIQPLLLRRIGPDLIEPQSQHVGEVAGPFRRHLHPHDLGGSGMMASQQRLDEGG